MNDGHINASMDINNASLDVTFGEVYEIDKGMPAAIIANLYSSQSTYSPGDYVIYRNKLYKCLVAIETPEEFDTEKWELVKVAEELKEKADKSTVYTKTETDALLDEKANATSVYTKTETDALLDKKANSDNVYTKTEADALLDEKANLQSTLAALSTLSDAIATKADAAGTTAALALKADKTYVDTELDKKADKSSTYTKTEVDTALASKAAADNVYTKLETDEAISDATKAIDANFALEFNPEWTYEGGEFCVYEGRLKRCVNGYNEPKPFDENDWEDKDVGQLIWGTEATISDGLNGKMDKSNPTGTGTLNINRKAGTTVGEQSVAIGYNSTASGKQSIAGGYSATASNTVSVALGNGASASGFAATAFGTSTKATGNYSQAEGYQTRAGGGSSHAEGNQSYAGGGVSHAEGYSTQASGQYSHAEGNSSVAKGSTSHAEGHSTTASGDYSHAEGRETVASAYSSHAEGLHTQATQNYSHSEGCSTIASGHTSHAEGYDTTASGDTSHAEGYETTASGTYSHAEGNNTTANSYSTHAEGDSTIASGDSSHAEGLSTTASGNYSHSEGLETIANHKSQHVFGEYNVKDNSENEQSERGNYVEIVGNGYWDSEEEEVVRSNARTLDWNGNEVLAGDLTFNGSTSLAGEISRLDGRIDNLPAPMIFKGTLGVGGTIQSLPTASASNEGFTYKVITDGTYAGQTAKVGDVFTSNGSAWVLIPSGDEDNDTWRAIKINGVEKLGNGISSGAVDFVGSENIEVEFDSNGNKVGVKTKNIYTKEEVDEIIYNILPTKSASGAIANFNTSLALPLKSLEADINAVQDLHGYDAPWVGGAGKNKLDETLLLDQAPWNLITIEVKPNTVYTCSTNKGIQTETKLFLFFKDNDSLGGGSASAVYSSHPVTITSTSDGKVYISERRSEGEDSFSNYHVQIEEGSTATDWTPYENICPITGHDEVNIYHSGADTSSPDEITITLGQTVYGVKIDKARSVLTLIGELFSTTWTQYNQNNGYKAYRSSTKIQAKSNENAKSNMVANFGTFSSASMNKNIIQLPSTDQNYVYMALDENADPTNVQIYYELATPIEIPLSDLPEIVTKQGTNNIWVDSGDIAVDYKCSVEDYIEEEIASVQALALNT